MSGLWPWRKYVNSCSLRFYFGASKSYSDVRTSHKKQVLCRNQHEVTARKEGGAWAHGQQHRVSCARAPRPLTRARHRAGLVDGSGWGGVTELTQPPWESCTQGPRVSPPPPLGGGTDRVHASQRLYRPGQVAPGARPPPVSLVFGEFSFPSGTPKGLLWGVRMCDVCGPRRRHGYCAE